jgi:hypothetical protein
MDTSGWDAVQVTDSSNHPEFSKGRRPVGDLGDYGGEFFTQRQQVRCQANKQGVSGSKMYGPNMMAYAEYSGPILAVSPVATFPPFEPSTGGQLDARGSTAISQCNPANSVANAAVFLGELVRDGLPNLTGEALLRWREGTKAARKASASEYLNVEFGYKPILSDMDKFFRAVFNSSRLLKQYERDSGRMVRRKYGFKPEIRTEVSPFGGQPSPWMVPSSDPWYKEGASGGLCIRDRTISRHQWFSGAFTYYLPSGYDSRNAMDREALRVQKIYGLELTPDVIWNIAPWSWAVDWMSNAGDVISNLSNWLSDGLVLRYGYMMETVTSIDTYTWVGPTGFQSDSVRPSTVSLISQTKQRRRATPFGFGLDWGMFSPRQWAIAAALGISRSK